MTNKSQGSCSFMKDLEKWPESAVPNNETGYLVGEMETLVVTRCFMVPLLILIGIPGNILILLVLRKEKLTSTLVLQFSVAFWDLTYLASSVIVSYDMCGQSLYHEVIRRLTLTFPSFIVGTISFLISLLGRVSIAFLAVERAVRICRPHLEIFTLRKTLGILLFLNFIVLAQAGQVIVLMLYANDAVVRCGGYNVSGLSSFEYEQMLLQSAVTHELYNKAVMVIIRLAFETSPPIIVILCNLSIARSLAKRSKQLLKSTKEMSTQRQARDAKINRTLFIITSSFVAFCLPGNLTSAAMVLTSSDFSGLFWIMGHVNDTLIALHHAINFVIYGLSNDRYRKRYKEIICCQNNDID